MAQFIAIPVTQGDAFYLERDNLSVLVDGGRNRRAFPSLFKDIFGKDGVDILVCTHNDADHANGIIGFLENGLRCNEVWLPGRWLGTMPDIFKPFFPLVEQLAEDASQMDPVEILEFESFEDYRHHLLRRESDDLLEDKNREEVEEVGEDGWTESHSIKIEESDLWEEVESLPLWSFRDWIHLYPPRLMQPNSWRLFLSAINAAKRIRSIAMEAYGRGIPVRWFEYTTSHAGGGRPELRPLNSRLIARSKKRPRTLFEYLALTVANRESLVFWSPPGIRHPGVLFTADSDLEGLTPPLELEYAISTAPHHGSQANANAYKKVMSIAPSFFATMTWVRSDGRSRSRPGHAYLHLPPAQRFCTLCRVGTSFNKPMRPIRLFSRKGRWVRHPNSSTCICT